MYRLKTEQSFDAAHFLSGYDGKCSNIHGHRWRVEIEIQGKELKNSGQERGMLTDFSIVKKDLKEITDSFDHRLIVEKDTLSPQLLELLREEDFSVAEVPFRPTAEEFARCIYDSLSDKGYDVYCVTVYETPANAASYLGDSEDEP